METRQARIKGGKLTDELHQFWDGIKAKTKIHVRIARRVFPALSDRQLLGLEGRRKEGLQDWIQQCGNFYLNLTHHHLQALARFGFKEEDALEILDLLERLETKAGQVQVNRAAMTAKTAARNRAFVELAKAAGDLIMVARILEPSIPDIMRLLTGSPAAKHRAANPQPNRGEMRQPNPALQTAVDHPTEAPSSTQTVVSEAEAISPIKQPMDTWFGSGLKPEQPHEELLEQLLSEGHLHGDKSLNDFGLAVIPWSEWLGAGTEGREPCGA